MGLLGKLFGGSPKKQPVHLTDDNFQEEVLRSDVPVLIDIWSDTCPPCKQLEPVIMSIAGKYDGEVKVCELNVREGRRTAAKYRVMGTPTVLYFKAKGVLHDRVVGFRGTLYHEQLIDNELLGRGPKGSDARA